MRQAVVQRNGRNRKLNVRQAPTYPKIHPQLQSRRSPVLTAVVVFMIALVVIAGIVIHLHGQRSPAFANDPYTPQRERNAEWVGNPDGPLSDQAVDEIAKNDSYEIIPKFAYDFDISKHFDEVNRLVDAAKKYGNDLKVFDYFSASYWINTNQQAWGRYSAGFQDSWLLRDGTGKTIPYFGTGGATTAGATVAGYVVDLSNPAYRAWAVSTIVSWMRAAPYSGIAFDAAAPMVGSASSRYIANGRTTYNALLCGSTVTFDVGNCPRVDAWNQGLIDLVTQASAALHKLGDTVLYNGIAPSSLRGVSRNVGMLRYADIAANEGFCTSVSVLHPDRVSFNSLQADATLMQQIAMQHKKVFEITNTYASSAKTGYGQYCLAGFLIGWQPGSSYYIYHTGYTDPLAGPYPEVAEQNLSLGQPLTTGYQTSGGALTRRFQNGFVAVNPGDSSVTVVVPYPVVEFKQGAAGTKFAAGASVTLPARGALLALNESYVYGANS